MDAQIKQLLTAPALYPASTTATPALLPEINAFVSKLRAAGKLTPNLATRAGFFSFHLAHLKLGIEFNVDELIKKSSLTPTNYSREFSIILRHCEQSGEPVISVDSIASFYSVPLQQILDAVASIQQQQQPVQTAEYWLAVLYVTSVSWKGSGSGLLPRLGTVASFARLWGQSPDGLKSFQPPLRAALKSDAVKTALEALLERSSYSKTTAAAAAAKRRATKRVRLAGPTAAVSSTFAFEDTHPLAVFSCATIGPAFGPVVGPIVTIHQ